MRTLAAALLALTLVAAPAGAKDKVRDQDAEKDKERCHLSVGPHDVVKKSGDVVVEAGQVVENAVALQGTVRVRKGAVVKTAMAVKGDVVVEDGGEVRETALSLGGAVRVKKGGVVKGSTLQLKEGALSLRGDSGGRVSGDLVVDGESLSTKVLAGILGSLEGCAVEGVPE